jgi:hypothetical protein
MKPFILSLAMFTIYAASTHAATYMEPKLVGMTLVKVDKIQLDSSTISWIAAYLTELADQQSGSPHPKNLLSSAKLIALAQQLDRSLAEIPLVNEKLKQATKTKHKKNDAQFKRKRLQVILKHLETDEPNDEGKLLAQLIKDALAGIAAENSPLAKYSAPAQLWQNSIAQFDNFKRTAPPIVVKKAPIKIKTPIVIPQVKLPLEKPQAAKEFADKAEWKLKEILLSAPLTTYKIVGIHNTLVYSNGLKKLAIKITPVSAEEEQITTSHSKPILLERDYLEQLSADIFKPLQSVWGDIAAAQFSFRLSDAYSDFSDHELTNSALTVAFDSALLGTPLKSKLLVIAAIDEKSEFQRNQQFWRNLDLLTAEARDTRILVGRGSEEYLLQLIALGKPEFFIQNEVIEIENLKQARKLTARDDHEDYAEATALFAEVKSTIEQKSLRSMTENKYVREKLEKVLVSMPNHLSAKILLEYGARKKTPSLDSKFFAISMKSLLAPANKILTIPDSILSYQDAMKQSELISDALENFQDIISEEDQIIYQSVDKIAEKLRGFSRAKESALESESSYYDNTATRTLLEIKMLNNALQADLDKLQANPIEQQ